MPRVRVKRNEYLAEDLRKAILKAGIDAGLTSMMQIASAVGIPYTTMQRRMAHIDTLNMMEIRQICEVLPLEKYFTPLLFGGKS